MKRTFPAVLAALALLAGCASNSPTSESGALQPTITENESETTSAPAAQPPESEAEKTNASVTESAPEEPPEDSADIVGVWQLFDAENNTGEYYIFRSDGAGATLNMEYGIGVGMGWSVEGAKGMFSFGAVDCIRSADVAADGDTLTLAWEDGEVYELTKLPNDPESFEFYSNEELALRALNFYENQTGYRPTSYGTQSNPNGTVTIQLYDSLEDHNSTSAWYVVNRFTAEGVDDMTKEPISLADDSLSAVG